MTGYVDKVLKRFTLPSLFKPHHSSHDHDNPSYEARVQYTAPTDTSPRISPKETTTVQEIIGTLLYYARVVDISLHVAVGTLS